MTQAAHNKVILKVPETLLYPASSVYTWTVHMDVHVYVCVI